MIKAIKIAQAVDAAAQSVETFHDLKVTIDADSFTVEIGTSVGYFLSEHAAPAGVSE